MACALLSLWVASTACDTGRDRGEPSLAHTDTDVASRTGLSADDERIVRDLVREWFESDPAAILGGAESKDDLRRRLERYLTAPELDAAVERFAAYLDVPTSWLEWNEVKEIELLADSTGVRARLEYEELIDEVGLDPGSATRSLVARRTAECHLRRTSSGWRIDFVPAP